MLSSLWHFVAATLAEGRQGHGEKARQAILQDVYGGIQIFVCTNATSFRSEGWVATAFF